jgi:Glycosyl hydrolase catalytic core
MGLGLRARTALAVLLALSIVLASATAAQALPARFWGAVPQSVLSLEQVQRIHRGGVDSIRIPISWGVVQPERGGAFDWTASDREVEKAARTGVEVLPFLVGVPSWAERPLSVGGSGGTVQVPANLPVRGGARAGWIAFIEGAVARYGPSGSFWSQNPSVPKRPIRAWQIWNEPNFKYFVHRPNPAEYGQLVKLSSTSIKGVDPGAEVILAGLFAWPRGGNTKGTSNHNYFADDFLEGMYRKTPGIAAKFDGVALHPYSTRFQLLTPQIEEVRAVLRKYRDSAKGLWITELGWSSKPPAANNSFAKGVNGQATQLKGAFSLLQRMQRKWRVQRVYWFSVDDYGAACNFCDGSGLFGAGFVPKRSWYTYVRFAGGTP